MAKNLVIVESPAKARTIERYLGSDYQVLASYGHVRDLPGEPRQGQVRRRRRPRLRARLRDHRRPPQAGRRPSRRPPHGADAVYLATDLDREGEAIAWHVAEAADVPHAKTRRVTFSEITEGAIREAFAQPARHRPHLVDAQQTRRIVDRLVGYTLSPLLSRKVRGGLSAGRVQSVAVRLVVEREREIRAFVAREYWTLEALLPTARRRPVHRRARRGSTASRPRSATARPRSATPTALRGLHAGRRRSATRGQQAQPGAAVHDQHAPAGGEPQARLQPQAHDVGRPAAVRGHRHAGRPRRPDHLHADRLDGHRRRRHGARPSEVIARALRRAVRHRQGPRLQDQARRAPRRRTRPSGRRRSSATPSRWRGTLEARRAPPLPADLAARARVADGGQGARDHDGRAGGGPLRPARLATRTLFDGLRARLHRGPGRRRRRGGGGAAAAARARATCTRVDRRHARPSTSPSRRRASPRRP